MRRATLRDQRRVERLWEEFLREEAYLDSRFRPADDALSRFQADYPVWLRDRTRFTGVAEVEDEVVGLITAHLWGPAPILKEEVEVFIEYLFVSPDARRRGIGTALVNEVANWAQINGSVRLRLRSLARSGDAHAFWTQLGAEPFIIERLVSLGERLPSEPKAPLGFRGNQP